MIYWEPRSVGLTQAEEVRKGFLEEVEREQTSERPTDTVLKTQLSFWYRYQDSGLIAPDLADKDCAHTSSLGLT